jgi:hypothetical protein
MKNKIFLLVFLPVLVLTLIWGLLAYSIIVQGMFIQFSAFLWPLLGVLFGIYYASLFFWQRTEQVQYRSRIDEMEMEVRSLLNRIDILEVDLEKRKKAAQQTRPGKEDE